MLKKIKNYNYKPFISIVIPTYNEEKIIASTLENILSIDYPKDRMEIIVIDSSDDKTPEIVAEYAMHHPYIRLIKTERKGVATARNEAYSIAKGEIVIKNDCDCMLESNAISEIVANFADARIGAVTSRVMAPNNERLEINYRSIHHRIQIAESIIDSTYIFNTLSAFRRDLIRPITTSADDADVALNIRRQGYKAIYDPDSIFYEASPLTAKERVEVKSRRAVGHINLLLKNIGLCFNPKLSWYGMLILPMNLFMIVISPILMLLIPIFSIIDMLTSKAFLLLDYTILGSIPLIFALRNKPIASKIWTMVELQIIQFIALMRVIKYGDMRTWKRAETTREYYARTAATTNRRE
ncbi:MULTISPECIES: glycosyltransferase [Candidatus Nitrosocaldus]|nr:MULTISPECIES: glycosyltransferase [Candidatus Nitrosocaldus]